MLKVFTIYFQDDDREPKRFEAIVGESIIQRQVIGAEGNDPLLEVALVRDKPEGKGTEIYYAYGVPTSDVKYYEFTSEGDEIVDVTPDSNLVQKVNAL